MKNVIFKTLLGFAICICGFTIAFISMSGLKDGGSPWLILLSIPLIALGVFFIFQAGRIDINKSKLEKNQPVVDSTGKESILEKNNKLVSEWIKTSEARDKLKILEIAAAAEEK